MQELEQLESKIDLLTAAFKDFLSLYLSLYTGSGKQEGDTVERLQDYVTRH